MFCWSQERQTSSSICRSRRRPCRRRDLASASTSSPSTTIQPIRTGAGTACASSSSEPRRGTQTSCEGCVEWTVPTDTTRRFRRAVRFFLFCVWAICVTSMTSCFVHRDCHGNLRVYSARRVLVGDFLRGPHDCQAVPHGRCVVTMRRHRARRDARLWPRRG